MPGTTTKLSNFVVSSSGVVVKLENYIFLLGFGLTVTDQKGTETRLNIRNVKRCRDGMPKGVINV